MVSVHASHASATDGLSLQQSSDGTNWDVTDAYTIPAATGKVYSIPRQARYFRVVYTNGGTGQTTFRLQTILNRTGTRTTSQRPSDAYTNETDLEQNQSFLMGYNGSTWDRVRVVSTTGEVRVMSHRETTRIAITSGGLTTATTAYTAGDQLGTQFTFTNASRASGGTGTIIGATVISAADIIGAIDLVVTRASVTLAGDNNAYAISDADALNVVGVIQMAGAFDIGNNRIAQAFNLAIPYDCSGGTSLFGSLITRVGHTFFAATTDLLVTLWVERN